MTRHPVPPQRGSVTACVTGCTQYRRHLSGCGCSGDGHQHDGESCEQCDGCLPRLAAPGLMVCEACEGKARRILAELADLYVSLAVKPSTSGPVSGGGSAGDPEACPFCDNGLPCLLPHRDTPMPISEGQIDARHKIVTFVRSWCQHLNTRHHITPPTDEDITTTTRSLARDASIQAAAHRLGSAILTQPHWDPSLQRMIDPDPATASALKASEHRHTKAADQARDDALTGRDQIEARTDHLARHLTRLLADPDMAGGFLYSLGDAYGAAVEAGPRARPTGVTVACDCGTTIRVTDTASVTCPDCDAVHGLDQHEPMTLRDLVDLLAGHDMTVTYDQLRQWSDRGYLTPVEGSGRGHARLYDPAAVLLTAHNRIGATT